MYPPKDMPLSTGERVILSTVSHVPKLIRHSDPHHLVKLVLILIV